MPNDYIVITKKPSMNIRDVENFADVDLFDGFAVELFFKSSHCMST